MIAEFNPFISVQLFKGKLCIRKRNNCLVLDLKIDIDFISERWLLLALLLNY